MRQMQIVEMYPIDYFLTDILIRDVKFAIRIGSDYYWPQMGQIWDFLRSVSVHFGSPSQNVLKLILKSPRFVLFGAYMTQFGCLIWHIWWEENPSRILWRHQVLSCEKNWHFVNARHKLCVCFDWRASREENWIDRIKSQDISESRSSDVITLFTRFGIITSFVLFLSCFLLLKKVWNLFSQNIF